MLSQVIWVASLSLVIIHFTVLVVVCYLIIAMNLGVFLRVIFSERKRLKDFFNERDTTYLGEKHKVAGFFFYFILQIVVIVLVTEGLFLGSILIQGMVGASVSSLWIFLLFLAAELAAIAVGFMPPSADIRAVARNPFKGLSLFNNRTVNAWLPMIEWSETSRAELFYEKLWLVSRWLFPLFPISLIIVLIAWRLK